MRCRLPLLAANTTILGIALAMVLDNLAANQAEQGKDAIVIKRRHNFTDEDQRLKA